MLPSPFNSVADLVRFTCFRQGDSNGVDSVRAGTFEFEQFTEALQRARNEIYARAGKKQNTEYDDYRLAQLQECELWFATARLYPQFGERIAIVYPESNVASIGIAMTGADSPPPSGPGSKGEFWVKFMSDRARAQGERLLTGQGSAWGLAVGVQTDSTRFPCLSSGDYCSCSRPSYYPWSTSNECY